MHDELCVVVRAYLISGILAATVQRKKITSKFGDNSANSVIIQGTTSPSKAPPSLAQQYSRAVQLADTYLLNLTSCQPL